eukprot:GHVN01092020.1.p1 GENE.GHVN01092020.1~~GHVN01092020.1.p1  ORF type:complete len:383 (-),score=96.67 GHVN01092020.1:392-1540(-)
MVGYWRSFGYQKDDPLPNVQFVFRKPAMPYNYVVLRGAVAFTHLPVVVDERFPSITSLHGALVAGVAFEVADYDHTRKPDDDGSPFSLPEGQSFGPPPASATDRSHIEDSEVESEAKNLIHFLYETYVDGTEEGGWSGEMGEVSEIRGVEDAAKPSLGGSESRKAALSLIAQLTPLLSQVKAARVRQLRQQELSGGGSGSTPPLGNTSPSLEAIMNLLRTPTHALHSAHPPHSFTFTHSLDSRSPSPTSPRVWKPVGEFTAYRVVGEDFNLLGEDNHFLSHLGPLHIYNVVDAQYQPLINTFTPISMMDKKNNKQKIDKPEDQMMQGGNLHTRIVVPKDLQGVQKMLSRIASEGPILPPVDIGVTPQFTHILQPSGSEMAVE